MPNISLFLFDPPEHILPTTFWSIIILFVLAELVVTAICFISTKDQKEELAARYFSSIILSIIVLPCIWAGGLAFAVLVAIVTGLSIREYLTLVNVWQMKPFRIISTVALASLVIAAMYESSLLWQLDTQLQLHPFFTLPLFWVASILVVPILLQSYRGMSAVESQVVFSIVYFSWFLPHFVLLRSGPNGFSITLFLCLAVIFNDVFAYFIGKTFGRAKLAPQISPKKTWEGIWGGFLGTIVAVFLFGNLWPDNNYWALFVYAIIISILSPVGDLIISVIKRDAGEKDSDSLIPGHGGVLDRVGSYILIAPLFYFVLRILRFY